MDAEGHLIEEPADGGDVLAFSLDEEEEEQAQAAASAPAKAGPVTAEFDHTLASGQITSDDLDVALSQLEGTSVVLEDDGAEEGGSQEQDDTTARPSESGDTRVEGEDGAQTFNEGTLDERILRKMDEVDSRASSDPLIGMVLGDRFEVLEKIGEGGMGAVYKACQKGIEREVAIKVLLGDVARNPTLVRRFHLEALAISKLKHPNTIQIFDFGESDEGLLYIAMELLEGTTLHSLLEFEEVLSVARAIRITNQISRSLREAHSKGIIHRDLKPDNVFLTSVGEEGDFVKVLDFGVAKLRDDDKKGATVTKTGTIFGTPRYMSPEQAKGKPVDDRADLYAIGIMLYEMVMGSVPFESDNHLGVLILHVQRAPPTFQEMRPDLIVPSKLEAVVFRLLAKSPDDRYQTAEALIKDLERVEKDLEDVFRNVMRHDRALEQGFDLTSVEVTHHDTRLDSAADQALPTMGPFGDPTVRVGASEPSPKRSPLVGRLFGTAVTLAAAAAGFLAFLPPLPAAYHGIPALATLDVGVQPAAQIPWSQVTVASDPAEARVMRIDGNGKEVSAGITPLSMRRHRGAAPETYAFSKEGYKRYQRTFEFNADIQETVRLVPLTPAKPAAKPASRPAAKSGTSGSKAKPATKAKSTDYAPGKVGTTKSSPY
jgi:serine/threonine protein kinase